MQSSATPQVIYCTITDALGAGQRIDNFLTKKLKNVPKSKIYNILRTGEVRVNKGRIKPSYKLQIDDIIRIPPLTQPNKEVIKPRITDAAIERIHIEQAILHEDAHLLIVNKPAGLAVHGGSGVSFGLIELLRELRQQGRQRQLELIHRIDRDTSGLVMLAKTPTMLRAMHKLFLNKQIQKTYHALVKGYAPDQFAVTEPLQKYILKSGERMVTINPEGQQAETHFKTLHRYHNATLLEATPITGRTHQIRVHAATRGLPIIGDQKYGDKAYNLIVRRQGLQRLFLHAYELRFVCPVTGKEFNIQAPHDTEWLKGIETWKMTTAGN